MLIKVTHAMQRPREILLVVNDCLPVLKRTGTNTSIGISCQNLSHNGPKIPGPLVAQFCVPNKFFLLKWSILFSSFNRLSELILTGRHYHLTKLDLSSNNISSVRGLRIDGLIHLSEINLSNNMLISLPPNSFATSGMLRSVYWSSWCLWIG